MHLAKYRAQILTKRRLKQLTTKICKPINIIVPKKEKLRKKKVPVTQI